MFEVIVASGDASVRSTGDEVAVCCFINNICCWLIDFDFNPDAYCQILRRAKA